MGLIVTQDHLDAAREAGACEAGLKGVSVGMRIEDLPQEHLTWAKDALPRAIVRDMEARAGVSLWGLSREGCVAEEFGFVQGHGYGCGDDGYSNGGREGVGDEYGAGYGYGNGYGVGSEDGYGDGDGR